MRGLSGTLLTCGCLAGVYETYDRRIVTTIDARGTQCDRQGHALHAILPNTPLEISRTVPGPIGSTPPSR